MTEEEVLKALKKEKKLPRGYDICVEAMRNVLAGHESDLDWIKDNFSDLIEEVQREAYRLYLKAERPAANRSIRTVFSRELPNGASSDQLFDLLAANFWALDKFFLGLTQGRRPRAGNAFEYVIKVLFKTLGYPYTPQAIINGQPDFLLPNIEHYKKNAMDCIIFTVKRTLRERWRQIISEGTQGHQFFLATIDEKVAAKAFPLMLSSRIYLVVPEAIRLKCYPKIVNVLSFESFFLKHLDPAMARWRADGVIPKG